jgi:hypothetical protein
MGTQIRTNTCTVTFASLGHFPGGSPGFGIFFHLDPRYAKNPWTFFALGTAGSFEEISSGPPRTNFGMGPLRVFPGVWSSTRPALPGWGTHGRPLRHSLEEAGWSHATDDSMKSHL